VKKIVLIIVVSLLSSCILVDSYRMARFDNNEYMLINAVRTHANLGASSCGTLEVIEVVNSIWYKAVELRNYSESIPHNNQTIKMTQELVTVVDGLRVRYRDTSKVSLNYCTLKFSNIEKSATIIQNVIGDKPR
jgi:hypothetical protein